ncbi:MAG: tetratricopeptide repeat protein [Spirosomataceae bacterium]
MGAKKSTESQYEFLESSDALANQLDKAQSFVQSNNKLFLVIGGVLLVGILAFVGFHYYQDSRESEAQKALYKAIYDFEADSLNLALNGKGGNEGLLAIADNYGSTNAGKLANFYAGVALLKEGKYDDAIARLKAYSSSDLLLQARAYALIGDAFMEKGDYKEAISYYKRAADYKPNQFFTPGYLLKLGLAYEKNNQIQEAAPVYKRIIDEFPMSSEVMNAKKYLGVVEGQVGK